MPKINSLGTGYNSPVRQWGSQRRRYPLPRDTSHYLVEEEYIVNASNYAVQARDTANGTYASAYNVDQQIISERGDMVRFRRTYATIPATRIEPAGTYNVRIPGLPDPSTSSPLTSTGQSFSSGTLTLDFGSSHGQTAGDIIHLALSYQRSVGGTTYYQTFSGQVEVATAPDADTITIAIGGQIPSMSSVTRAIILPVDTYARGPRDATIPTFIQYEYALPGVTSGITDLTDFLPIPVPSSLDNTAGTTVNTLSATTTPTAAEYLEWVGNGSLVPIESDVRPYLGNILERATRYYIAQ